MARTPSDTQAHLEIDAGDLTLGNLAARLGQVIAYARSKGAPDDASVRIHVNDLMRPDRSAAISPPPPLPHNVEVTWQEGPVVPDSDLSLPAAPPNPDDSMFPGGRVDY